MNDAKPNEMKVAMHQADGAWRVVVERDGQRRELSGIGELICYLESLAVAGERPARGLR